MDALNRKIMTMRAWIRREDKHKRWTKYQLRERIDENWPELSQADKIRIFQDCLPPGSKR